MQLLLSSSRATIVAVVQHTKIAVHHQDGMLCGHRQLYLLICHTHQHGRLSWFVRTLGLWRYRWWGSALERCWQATASKRRAALSLEPWHLPIGKRQLCIELRGYAGWHGCSLKRPSERSTAWRQPQCPLRAVWLLLSAKSGQRRAGVGGGEPPSAAVPACSSWSRSSADLSQDRSTTAARSDMGALGTRVARVYGHRGQQVIALMARSGQNGRGSRRYSRGRSVLRRWRGDAPGDAAGLVDWRSLRWTD